MRDLLLGALVGLTVGVLAGWPTTTVEMVAVGAAVAAYLISCWGYPRRKKCWFPFCGSNAQAGDGRGNVRDKARRCLVCGGSGQPRRVGAVLIGRGRR